MTHPDHTQSDVTYPGHTQPDTTGGFSHQPHGPHPPPPTYPPDTGKYDYRKWPILIILSLMWPILILLSLMWPILIILSLIPQVDSLISHMVPTLLHPLNLRIQVIMIIESDPSWSYPVWCDPSWSYLAWCDPSWSYPVWCDPSWSYSPWYYRWILTSATWWHPSPYTHTIPGYR